MSVPGSPLSSSPTYRILGTERSGSALQNSGRTSGTRTAAADVEPTVLRVWTRPDYALASHAAPSLAPPLFAAGRK